MGRTFDTDDGRRRKAVTAPWDIFALGGFCAELDVLPGRSSDVLLIAVLAAVRLILGIDLLLSIKFCLERTV